MSMEPRELANGIHALFEKAATANGQGKLDWLGESERMLLLFALGIATGVALERARVREQ